MTHSLNYSLFERNVLATGISRDQMQDLRVELRRDDIGSLLIVLAPYDCEPFRKVYRVWLTDPAHKRPALRIAERLLPLADRCALDDLLGPGGVL